jgi:DNA-directed RNA polymerase omega subunit
MVKAAEELADNIEEQPQPEIDSKYRLIILAAKRSKQLQRGARPRIETDMQKHKPTRIAVEEILRGKINFTIEDEEMKGKDEG